MGRKFLFFLTGATLFLFVVACAQDEKASEASTLNLAHVDERISRASENTIHATLGQISSNDNSDFLLTISNSTTESIKLFTSADGACFDETFWFYAKTSMGWQPRPPLSSFICFPEPTNDSQIEIPSNTERVYPIGFLIGSRGLNLFDPSYYIIRIKYLNSTNLPLLFFSNKFQYGSSIQANDEQFTLVENVEGKTLSFRFINNSDKSLWLSPMCGSTHLASGGMDELNSGLQRLTEETSWVNIQIQSDKCSKTNKLIEIKAGETLIINGAAWLQDAELLLQPGLYRWNIIIFLNRSLLGVEDGRHVFSDVFEYKIFRPETLDGYVASLPHELHTRLLQRRRPISFYPIAPIKHQLC